MNVKGAGRRNRRGDASVVVAVAVSVGSVGEKGDLRAGVEVKRSEVDCKVACGPVGDASDKPVAPFAACRHDVFTHLGVEHPGLVPYGGDRCDEVGAFLLAAVIAG